MVKPLMFKGDKKPKKRKRTEDSGEKVAKELKVANDVDEDAAEDDTWVSAEAVSDVIGPVMFVLPSSPPSALACDAQGRVFALPIENIVDGNPGSAEPHDVRQVWVANRVAGTENYRFKGHHGRYAGPKWFETADILMWRQVPKLRQVRNPLIDLRGRLPARVVHPHRYRRQARNVSGANAAGNVHFRPGTDLG